MLIVTLFLFTCLLKQRFDLYLTILGDSGVVSWVLKKNCTTKVFWVLKDVIWNDKRHSCNDVVWNWNNQHVTNMDSSQWPPKHRASTLSTWATARPYIVMKNNSIGMKFKKGVGADHLFHCLSLHWKVFSNYDHSSNHKVKATYTVFTEIYSVLVLTSLKHIYF